MAKVYEYENDGSMHELEQVDEADRFVREHVKIIPVIVPKKKEEE